MLFEIKDALREHLYYSWKDPLITYYERIRNVIQCIPFTWKDLDWSNESLFDVIQFKLSRMRKVQESNKRGSNYKLLIKQIRTCELLCDRISKNDYCSLDFDLHYKKHRSLDRLYIVEMTNEERKEFKQLVDRSEYLYQQDICYLFNCLRKKNRSWWDQESVLQNKLLFSHI